MKTNIKFLLNIIFSLIIISTGLNANMYIENVAADNTDASGKLIQGGIDLDDMKVMCWNGRNWPDDKPTSKIAKNSYLTHDCGKAEYFDADNAGSGLHNFAPADLYYKGQIIGVPWQAIDKEYAYGRGQNLYTKVKRGTLDSIGNPHYCLKMVNGKLTVTYNGENNCPRTLPLDFWLRHKL